MEYGQDDEWEARCAGSGCTHEDEAEQAEYTRQKTCSTIGALIWTRGESVRICDTHLC